MLYLIFSKRENIKRDFALDEILNAQDKKEEILNMLLKKGELRLGIVNIDKHMERYVMDQGYPVGIIEENKDYIHPQYQFQVLPLNFFERDAKKVAKDLLGKLLVRKLGNNYIIGKIVETEAYYGPEDPASRAKKGKKEYNTPMWFPGGHIFIYMVHANWMLNFTTDYDEAQAVLIRAVEPIAGIYLMRKRRRRKNIRELCSGPGKLSQSFYIHRNMNGKKIGDELFVANSPWKGFKIKTSHRIGVTEDVEDHLRFFIYPNEFVSRRPK